MDYILTLQKKFKAADDLDAQKKVQELLLMNPLGEPQLEVHQKDLLRLQKGDPTRGLVEVDLGGWTLRC